ncbi:MAG: hypothetical protein RR332_07235, partial [Clostridiales bacterium]
ETGKMVTAVSWQDSLQRISQSSNLHTDLPLNVYNEGVSKAIEATMEELRTNAAFLPLQEFTPFSGKATGVHLDRMIMLMGTMSAAWDPEYNINPSLDDALRAPYYTGQKSIYDPGVVWGDFSIYFTGFSYFLVYAAAYLLAKDLLTVCLNCIARVFNMVVLYVIAPPIIG